MQTQTLRLRVFALVAGFAALAFSGWVRADPPSRVARIAYTVGAVSFSPAGESDWAQAAINRPLTNGDRLWTDVDGRTEIQVGSAVIRMNASTGVSVLNLDDQIAQLQLTQGTLSVRVLRLEPGQVFEIDTPNLAFALRQPGEYRIAVDPDVGATDIVVRKGQGEAYGEGAAYVVDARQPYRFTGTGLREYLRLDAPRLDEFDRWASDRDRKYDSSVSARYVSQDVVGYQDLDANGSWRADATYGNVWIPNRVAADWAPYHDGHWAWIDPWGWTWVDDAPWGFAVSHYGRWANMAGTWGWVPGPVHTRAYYAPALVVFVGGSNFQLAISGGNVGGVAWFPLGPREVYRPSYQTSRGYFENVNRSNTVITNTVINNTYNTTNVKNITNITYVNQHVPGAVVAVPTAAFVQSRPVANAAVRVTREMVASVPIAVAPAVAPTIASVHGAAGSSSKPTPPRVFERAVVARAAPPAAHVGFAAQQAQLAAKPGTPLADAARKDLQRGATAPVPVVKVVVPAQTPPPKAPPPPTAPAVPPTAVRATTEGSKTPSAPAVSSAPTRPAAPATAPTPNAPSVPNSPPTQGSVRPQTTPAVPALPPATAASIQRAKPEVRGVGEQHGPATAPPASAPQAVAGPKVPAPRPAASAAAPQSPPPRAMQPKDASPPAQTPVPARPAQPAPKPEPAAAVQRPEPHSPDAAPNPPQPKPAPPVSASPQPRPEQIRAAAPQAKPEVTPPAQPKPAATPPAPPQPVPRAAQHGPEPKPEAANPKDLQNENDKSKREAEKRKQPD